MKQEIKLGVTDRTVLIFIPDPASTDGSGKTALVAADLTVSYARVETDNDVTITDVTSSLNNLSTLTDAHNDWGLLKVSDTLAPGLYRLDIADAVFASGAWSSVVYVMITTSAAAASPMEFILVAFDQLDGVRLGLTALPNAAADAPGGLIISDAGGLDADAQRSDVAAILVDTAEIGAAGAGLTSINLPDQTMNITGNITGNLTGSVGSVAAGGIAAASFAADAIDASALAASAANEIRDAVFARAFSAAYGAFTFEEMTELIAAILLAKVSGMDTNAPAFRNLNDTADTVVATTDASGNRLSVTLTP